MGVSRFYHIPKSGKLDLLDSVAEVMERTKEGGFFWLYYLEPTAEDLHPLIGLLDLHALSVEDALDDNQIPKIVAIEALEDELAEAEDAVLERPVEFDPKSLQHIRRALVTLRKCLFHEREVFVKICRKDCPLIPDKAIFHYRDVYDHLTRFFELTETLRDVATSLMEIDLSLRSNEMSRAANRTNRSVRRLTFITTIFLPLSLLAGVGGMSEWSMMTGPAN